MLLLAEMGAFQTGSGGAYSVAAVVMQIFPFLLLFISSRKNMGIWRQMNFAELATLECFLHFDKKNPASLKQDKPLRA